jgi:hypothetical protein
VPHQFVSHGTRHVYDACFPALWKREVLAAIQYLHLPPDAKYPAPVVNVLQTETENLTLAQTASHPQNHRYTVPLADPITYLSSY